MPNAFIRKLQGFKAISDAERAWLDEVTAKPVLVEADTDLIHAGAEPSDVHLILSGLAVRYKISEAGNRQIFAYLLAGDFCDLHVALLKRMDHSIGTVTPCHVVRIPRETILRLTEQSSTLAQAFWWCTLVDEAILREWLVNLGGRAADKRIAHLFCELYARLGAVGLTTSGTFLLPITQHELADTMGLSAVHVNRSLMSLKERGLVMFRDKSVEIPDIAVLKAFAAFDPDYLHRQSSGAESKLH